MRTTPLSLRSSRRRGFSAVEVIAVATIIGILALILIPILTKQVDKSRTSGVQDEMGQIARVMTLAHAETSRYFRLQDLDNNNTYKATPDDVTTEVPITYFATAPTAANTFPWMLATERSKLSKIWDGPRTTFHNYATIRDLYNSFPMAFTLLSPPMGTPTSSSPQQTGPILVYLTKTMTNPGDPLPTDADDEQRDRYPVDPWGNPYFFFPSGKIQAPAGGETDYSNPSPVLFSLGPDGLPGSKAPESSLDYFPAEAGGQLGAQGTDDVVWKF
jgi:prepilin-type N-terminal cleavage/methylation domain-containing protein